MVEFTEEKYKRAKEDLEDLESYIKEFSNFLPLAVCNVNPLGVITDFNKAAKELTGYNSLETIGERLDVFLKQRGKLEKIDEDIKNIDVFSIELILLTKKKKEIPINASISKRKDKNGEYIGFFMAFSDITEIKTLQEELEKKVKTRTKELQGRVEELERFHDLTVGRELAMMELKKEIERLKYVNKSKG